MFIGCLLSLAMFMVFVKLGYVYGVWRAIYFLFSTCTGEDLVKVFEETFYLKNC